MAAAIAAVAVMLGSVATAEAKNLGSTTLKPNVATFEALADLGVAVTPIGKAEATNKGIAFPITGAKLSQDLTGKIDHKGGLKFASESAKLKVKNFQVKIGERKAKLFAFAGEDKVRLLDLDLGKAKVKDGGQTVKGIKATLAKPGAEALSATFGAPIDKGTKIGKVTVAFK
jgi:hypothetical protein